MSETCRNLVLIGYRGAGKSAVGRAIAGRLHWSFVDTDEMIEAREGCSIAEIFEQRSEAAFRAIESDVIEQLQDCEKTVVSAGGGAVLRQQNVAQLKKLGPIVWLEAPANVLWQRMQQDEATAVRRPNLTAVGGLEEVQRLLADRTPIYEAAADHRIDTAGLSPEQVTDQIITTLRIA